MTRQSEPDRSGTGISKFSDRLWDRGEARQSWVCLGLDVAFECLPHGIPRSIDGAAHFIRNVIDACIDDVVAVKPNLAFYLRLGSEGIQLLADSIQYIDRRAIVILDGKFGDVPNTAAQYAKVAFDQLGADAVTVDVYGGWDTVDPFLQDPSRGVFVWTRSSNSGADDIQSRQGDVRPVFEDVARGVQARSGQHNIGVVVGATRAGDVRRIRQLAPDGPFLVPGVGAQGGDLEAVVRTGFGGRPSAVLINAGRSALWASGDADYARATRGVVSEMRHLINAVRSE